MTSHRNDYFYRLLSIAFFLLLLFTGRAQQPILVLPIGHSDQVYTAVFSPDGKKIITASQDKTAKIWDAASGALLADLKEHTNQVYTAVFSPDGKKIVTASGDATAKIWDATTGSLLFDLKGHSMSVSTAVFSPDGTKIATTSIEHIVRIWNVENGRMLTSLTGHTRTVNSAIFSADSKKIITASFDRTAKLWEVASGKLLLDLKGHSLNVVTALLSNDHRIIVTASFDGTAKTWDANTGALLKTLEGHTAGIMAAAISPDGKKIATASADKTVKLWDLATGRLMQDLKLHTDIVKFVCFSPDGDKLISASADKTAKIWEVPSGKLLLDITAHRSAVNAAGFSPDGKKFITASEDNTAKLWELKTGNLLADLTGHTFDIAGTVFSPDNKLIATTYWNGDVKIWDRKTLNLLTGLPVDSAVGEYGFAYRTVAFSSDGKKIAASSWDNKVTICDPYTGNRLITLLGHLSSIHHVQFSPDSKRLITRSTDNTAKIWDATSGKLLLDLQGHHGKIVSFIFNRDQTKIVTTSFDKTTKIWDASNGHLIVDLVGHNDWVYAAVFNAAETKLLTFSRDHTAKLWDAHTGKLLTDMTGHTNAVSLAKYSPDETKIITCSEDNTAKIWDAATGKLIATLPGHNAYVSDAIFSADGKAVVTKSTDNRFKLWESTNGTLLADFFYADKKLMMVPRHSDVEKIGNAFTSILSTGLLRAPYDEEHIVYSDDKNNYLLISGNNTQTIFDATSDQPICTFFAVDSTDYFNQLPNGYYQSTSNAVKLLHYVTSDLKIISFDQLDVKFNRPDKVLQAIGNRDTGLVMAYAKAYYKRIRKLGIDTNYFRTGYNVPRADFKNRDKISYEQTGNKISLTIHASDDSLALDRFNCWVNESPLFGVKGFSLINRNTRQFDTSITLLLSDGINRIETSVINRSGLESYRMPLDIKYQPLHPSKEKLFFIGIGIDHFKDSKYNLNWSVKDIRNLADSFKNKYGAACILDTLFNEQVSREGVLALKKRLLTTTVNDKVIIAYSGHGLLGKDFDYFLSTYTIDFHQPEIAGLPYDLLEDLLDKIPARKKLMLIDACHSGEVDREEMAKMVAVQTRLGDTKGVILRVDTTNKKMGTKNSFELMQQLFINVARSTGATVISAAAGTQFAMEKGDLRNGVFTYSILELMKQQQHINISALQKYVNARVPQLTNGLQVPTSRSENKLVDWQLW